MVSHDVLCYFIIMMNSCCQLLKLLFAVLATYTTSTVYHDFYCVCVYYLFKPQTLIVLELW